VVSTWLRDAAQSNAIRPTSRTARYSTAGRSALITRAAVVHLTDRSAARVRIEEGLPNPSAIPASPP
jgi:hypothetical protein